MINTLKCLCLAAIVPSVFFNHVSQFDDVFALLVLLAGFIGLLVLPSEGSLAAVTIDVSHSVKAGEENPFFCLATAYVDHRVK